MLALAALLLVVAAGNWTPVDAQTAEGPRLRVINTLYQTDPVDVLINDAPLVEALEYADASDYQDVPGGEIQLVVGLADGDALIEETIELENGADHSLVLLGDADAFDFVIQTDDTTPPLAGLAKITFVNANYDGLDLSLLLGDGSMIVEGLPYSDASDYVELEPGDYDLIVETLDDATEFASLSGATLDDQTTYSIIAIGVPDDAQLLLLEDQPRSGPPAPTATPGSPTAAATPTGAAGASPTVGTGTPVATATATHTVVPDLPDTGLGGSSSSDAGGSAALPLFVTLLAAFGALAAIRMLRSRLARN
jgi:hypothetical protein